ncbi:MAG: ABC transporter ATP-binding protein [Alphaproteobacteria bacterium]
MNAPLRPVTSPAAIAFRDLTVELGGKVILDRVTLDIAPGEFVSVMGPSGCGKTTLLRVIAGLVSPKSGAADLFGRPAVGPSRDIAVVFQDYGRALLPWRDAAGNVALALEAAGTPKGERGDIVARLLTKVGLGDHAAKFPGELSGGMQQRLQIARCLAQEPRILLMDEPFGALDAMTRQQLQDEIQVIAAERGTTVFFVTHDLEEALYLGDRVVALLPNPGHVARIVDVPLARPRNQLSTREHPDFLRLRRDLYAMMHEAHR